MVVEELNEEFNKLEIEAHHESPRCVLDIPITDASSSSSSSSVSETVSSESSNARIEASPFKGFLNTMMKKKKKKTGVKKLSTCTFGTVSSYDMYAKSIRKKMMGRIGSAEDGIDCGFLPTTNKPSWRSFSYSELEAATNNFSDEMVVGKGGHAQVYKGFLHDGTIVAVKRLTKVGNKEEEDDERSADFLSELGIIAHVEHRNTAKLIGFGVEGGLFLILHYCPHGSVASCLQGENEVLDWETRYKVAVGVAEGLSYLHHTCPRRIIHRDIKASNILLAEDYEPMISDFGLAKWLPDKWLHHVVYPIEGTFGYLAPEYFMHGIADERTDVFAYGVLLLELITGRHAVGVDSNHQSLVMWAKPHLDKDNPKELVDPRLGENYDQEEMKRVMATASMCIRHTADERPYMKTVIELLKGKGLPIDKINPMTPSLVQDTSNLEDYTSSNYLKDLNRHRELVME